MSETGHAKSVANITINRRSANIENLFLHSCSNFLRLVSKITYTRNSKK